MKVFGPSVQMLEQLMTHARDRHGVLSSNVANVDTPNYRAKDLTPFDAEMARSGSVPATSTARTADDQRPREDGNTVSLEKQMAKLEENRVRYGVASSVVSRRLALLRYVVTDGNG